MSYRAPAHDVDRFAADVAALLDAVLLEVRRPAADPDPIDPYNPMEVAR